MVRIKGLALNFYLDIDEARVAKEVQVVRPNIIDFHGKERSSRLYLAWRAPQTQGHIIEIHMRRARPGDPLASSGL